MEEHDHLAAIEANDRVQVFHDASTGQGYIRIKCGDNWIALNGTTPEQQARHIRNAIWWAIKEVIQNERPTD